MTAIGQEYPLKRGDRVAYYVNRNVSAGHGVTHNVQVRRQGIVKGWRAGKVIVQHKAGYTVDVPDADLYVVDAPASEWGYRSLE
jgi:hypothetical protein